MATDKHVAMLKKGVDAWNAWRDKNPNVRPDLTGAKLIEARLNGANLSHAMLEVSDLHRAVLEVANLSGANLAGADLSGASLTAAHLDDANLVQANMAGADLREAFLWLTVFGNTTLSEVKGLDQCRHSGPSFIDFQTLQTLRNSGPLPIAFMRGVGLSDNVIEYLPSLLNEAIQHYSCFIILDQGPGLRRAPPR